MATHETLAVDGRTTGASDADLAGPSRRQRFMAALPVTGPLVGAPLWWVLGLFQLVFFLAAAVMLARLLRQRRVAVPRGFGVWLTFLVWLLVGLLVLQVDAPAAVAGQSNGRYLTFAYRFGWYVSCTIAVLYVLNTRRTVSTERVCAAVAWFFVILVGGGLLGILRPQLSFPSALELVLPGRLTRQPFVAELIHPSVAQIHDFLGSAAARPSAPFPYTNSWGMAVALTIPVFVTVWWRRGGRWRWAMAGVLALAAIPIISSLNRGVWLSIGAVVLLTAIRSALSGRIRLLGGILAMVLVVGLLVVFSPLGAMVQARLDNPHSDEGRSNLSTQSVVSTLEGSPVIGFGSTRDMAGNFASIAGGASHMCGSCSPPPLGTHGQAWLLIFASGFGGFLLYTAFVGGQFLRHLRSRAPVAPGALGCLLVLLVTMPIYNAVGIALFVGFLVIGVLARESDEHAPTWSSLTGPVRRGGGLVLALSMAGLLGGLAVHWSRGEPARATQAVLVPVVDLTGVPESRALTLDSEALLVRSGPVLHAIAEATGTEDLDVVSDRLAIGAEPNTRVLTISYTDRDADAAAAAVEAATSTFLAERAALSDAARESVTTRLVARQESLNTTYRTVEGVASALGTGPSRTARGTMEWLRLQMNRAFAGAQAAETGDIGFPITQVRVQRGMDRLLVRVGSGVAIGAAAGLLVARHLGDRRRARTGRQAEEILDLPVVLETHPAANSVSDQIAADTVDRYRPLRGVLADPDAPAAVALAGLLNQERESDPTDARALLVISRDTAIDGALRLRARCRG
ncbi:MAG TPA: hypothetical protein VK053_21265, partial [Jiangellaceae bacterium]|nr:hypothetical protein [Jiangellaceae bacterium]